MAFLDETGLAELWSLVKARDLQMETGSYKGTGTSGKSNPNTLTFSFVPKLVIVSVAAGSAPSHLLLVNGMTTAIPTNMSSSYQPGTYDSGKLRVSWSGNSVSWYTEQTSMGEYYQLNTIFYTNYYVAIG